MYADISGTAYQSAQPNPPITARRLSLEPRNPTGGCRWAPLRDGVSAAAVIGLMVLCQVRYTT